MKLGSFSICCILSTSQNADLLDLESVVLTKFFIDCMTNPKLSSDSLEISKDKNLYSCRLKNQSLQNSSLAAKPERKNSRLWKIRQKFKFWQPIIVCVTALLTFLVKLILML